MVAYLDMNPPLSHFLRASVFSGKSNSGRWRTSTSTESSAWTSGRRRSSRADTMSCGLTSSEPGLKYNTSPINSLRSEFTTQTNTLAVNCVSNGLVGTSQVQRTKIKTRTLFCYHFCSEMIPLRESRQNVLICDAGKPLSVM